VPESIKTSHEMPPPQMRKHLSSPPGSHPRDLTAYGIQLASANCRGIDDDPQRSNALQHRIGQWRPLGLVFEPDWRDAVCIGLARRMQKDAARKAMEMK
jgi:hypothetical protein